MVAGNIAELGFSIQATPGVAAASVQHRIYVSEMALAPTRETADIEETSGSRMRAATYVVRTSSEGDNAAFARPDMIGALAYGALGAKAVTGASDPFTHTFTGPVATQPFFTFWLMVGNLRYERFVDCKIVFLELSSEAGRPIRVGFGVTGLSPTKQSAFPGSPPAVEKVPVLMHTHAGAAGFKLEGVGSPAIEAWRLRINNGVEAIQGTAVTPYALSEGMVGVEVMTRALWTDQALWNRFHYGVASPADSTAPTTEVIELGGSPAGIDAKFTVPGAPERSLEWQVPRLAIATPGELRPNTDGSPIRQEVTYRGLEPTGVPGVTIKVLNSKASYVGA